jgi:uncharacterized protein
MVDQQPDTQQTDTESADIAPWTTQQTFLGVLLTIIPWIVLALTLSSFNTQSTPNARLSPQADLVGAIVAFIFSVLIEGAFLIAPLAFAHRAFQAIRPHGRLVLRALGFRSFSPGQALFWIIVFILVILGVNNLYQYVITVLHLNIQTNDQVLLQQSKVAPLTTYATLLAAVVIAPFCEEVFFRGFVFPGLRRDMSVGWAIIISSLLFAITHADPGSFAVLFVIGLALAFLRWRTKSIWPGMLLHMLNNAIAAIVIILAMHGIIKP